MLDPSISLRNAVVSSSGDFVSSSLFKKLRQVAPANEQFYVDAENLVSALPATERILNHAIVVFQTHSLHKLNLGMKTQNIDSSTCPRGD